MTTLVATWPDLKSVDEVEAWLNTPPPFPQWIVVTDDFVRDLQEDNHRKHALFVNGWLTFHNGIESVSYRLVYYDAPTQTWDAQIQDKERHDV